MVFFGRSLAFIYFNMVTLLYSSNDIILVYSICLFLIYLLYFVTFLRPILRVDLGRVL